MTWKTAGSQEVSLEVLQEDESGKGHRLMELG